jgi:VanZ like family
MVRRLGKVGLLIAWMVLISYWSDQPTLPIDQPAVRFALFNLQHKLAHLVAFGLLALLARWTFADLRPSRADLLAVLVPSLFGVFDEYHQSFIPGRRAALDDWLTDTLFAGLAVYARHLVLRRRAVATSVRRIAPYVVAVMFLVGIGLAARAHVPQVRDLEHQVRVVVAA